jgi:hypothetical protein
VRNLPDDLVHDLETQTHEYALAHATPGSPEGWLIFGDGIESWWTEAAGLTRPEFGRLFHLRTDVVKRLTDRAKPACGQVPQC